MNDNLENFAIYKMSLQLWDEFWKDSDIMSNDVRRREMVRQMTRSVYSISANIEERDTAGVLEKSILSFSDMPEALPEKQKEAMLSQNFC